MTPRGKGDRSKSPVSSHHLSIARRSDSGEKEEVYLRDGITEDIIATRRQSAPVDTHTGFPLWSERYDREMKDVFEVPATPGT
jgi:TolB-like protein